MKKILIACTLSVLSTYSFADSNTYETNGYIQKITNKCVEHYSFNRNLGNLNIVEESKKAQSVLGDTGTKLVINSDYKLGLELSDEEPRALVYRGIDSEGNSVERIASLNTYVSKHFEIPIAHEQIHIGLYKTCAFIQ